MSDFNRPDPAQAPAMQTTCLKCGQEQYSLNVINVSLHRGACCWCGSPGEPMTEAEYDKALRKLKELSKNHERNS